jgi:hypothetical protein
MAVSPNEKYREEKFSRVFDKLDSIHTEVKRTNGRVSKLEDQVKCLELHDVKEPRCPNTPMVLKHEEELLEYRFLKKYPKISVGMLVLVLIYALYEIVSKVI